MAWSQFFCCLSSRLFAILNKSIESVLLKPAERRRNEEAPEFVQRKCEMLLSLWNGQAANIMQQSQTIQAYSRLTLEEIRLIELVDARKTIFAAIVSSLRPLHLMVNVLKNSNNTNNKSNNPLTPTEAQMRFNIAGASHANACARISLLVQLNFFFNVLVFVKRRKRRKRNCR